jgi:hypothetical protein
MVLLLAGGNDKIELACPFQGNCDSLRVLTGNRLFFATIALGLPSSTMYWESEEHTFITSTSEKRK